MRNKLAVAGALVVTAATCLGLGIAQGASSPANSGAVHHAAHQPAFTGSRAAQPRCSRS